MGESLPSHDMSVEERLRILENRMSAMEARLGLAPVTTVHDAVAPADHESVYSGESIEAGIGEFGLGWLGTAITFLGIVFLMTYSFSAGHRILGCILGYGASIGMYLAALHWQSSVRHLARTTMASSLLLAFTVTARLHFYSEPPLIENPRTVIVLLTFVVALVGFLAVQRRSQGLAGLSILLGLTTALWSDSSLAIFLYSGALCGAVVILSHRYGWRALLNAAIPMVYLAHFVWLLGNPVAGHAVKAVTAHQYNLFWLFLYAASFSVPPLIAANPESLDISGIGAIFLNVGFFSLVLAAVCFVQFTTDFPAIFLAAALICLILSIGHWVRRHEELVPAIYACFGFMALSIGIYGYTRVPDAFFWLSLQSLLVVSMALWFRSRVLVVTNSLIYVTILLTYLLASASSNWVNFSFALVGLASARVMNWKRERLTLRTDMLRNVYLTLAFFLMLYSLYRAVPGQYVTLTWTAAAAAYFLMSMLLRNVKYRWMAVFTMLVAIGHLFLIDLAQLNPAIRVTAFLILGVFALVISIFYTRHRPAVRNT